MKLSNCFECGKLAVVNASNFCPACQQAYFAAEDTVTDFLRDHEDATIEQVHRATGIKKHIIMKMIREGKVMEGGLTYYCDKCGKAIKTGLYCKECSTQVMDSIKPDKGERKDETELRGMVTVNRDD